MTLVKSNKQVTTSSNGKIRVNTKDLSGNPFGRYDCILNASGVVLQREVLIKEKGSHACIPISQALSYYT